MKYRYPRLTPLRAFELLEYLNGPAHESYKLSRAREVLAAHIKAALVARNKRKRKRKASKVTELRSVG